MSHNKVGYVVFIVFTINCVLLYGWSYTPSIRMRRISELNPPKLADAKLSSIPLPYVYDWHALWGPSESDHGEIVALDSSENVFVAGSTKGSNGLFDFFLLKYDNSGGLLWERIWGGSSDQYCYGMAIDSLDNIYLVGSSADDTCLVKYNNSGHLEWNEIWNGGDYDVGLGVAIDSNDDIFLAGTTTVYNPDYNLEFLLIKYDKDGTYQWHRRWGNNGDDLLENIIIGDYNNIYLAGITEVDASMNIILFKCDSSGGISWNATWIEANHGRAYAINLDSLNNIYVGGHGGIYDKWVILKFTNEGSLVWSKYESYSYSECKEIFIDSSDNIYATGFSLSTDFILVKYSPSGDEELDITWGSEGSEYSFSVAVDSWSNIYLTGSTDGFEASGSDNCLVRFALDSDGDNLIDQDEVTVYFTDPNNEDSDEDGVEDGEEVLTYGTDPKNEDTDSDGMPDGWEIMYSLDPLVNDMMLDPDQDSLTNIEEFLLNTNPMNPDTDSDGYSDGEEVKNNTDPLDPNSHPQNNVGIDGYNVAVICSAIFIFTIILIKKRR
jgi:hypothetical protein